MNKLLLMIPTLCLGIASSVHGMDDDKHKDKSKKHSKGIFSRHSKDHSKDKDTNECETLPEKKKKPYQEYETDGSKFEKPKLDLTKKIGYCPVLPTGGWNGDIKIDRTIVTQGFNQVSLDAYFSYFGYQPEHGQYTTTVGVAFGLGGQDDLAPHLQPPYNDYKNPISLVFQNNQLLKVIYPKSSNGTDQESSGLTITYPEDCGITPTTIEIEFDGISLLGGRKAYTNRNRYAYVVDINSKTPKADDSSSSSSGD